MSKAHIMKHLFIEGIKVYLFPEGNHTKLRSKGFQSKVSFLFHGNRINVSNGGRMKNA